jgi:hypothetical protein
MCRPDRSNTVAFILPSLNNLHTIRYNTPKYYDAPCSSASKKIVVGALQANRESR